LKQSSRLYYVNPSSTFSLPVVSMANSSEELLQRAERISAAIATLKALSPASWSFWRNQDLETCPRSHDWHYQVPDANIKTV